MESDGRAGDAPSTLATSCSLPGDKPLDHLLIVRAFACMCVLLAHTAITIDHALWQTVAVFGSINLKWLLVSCPQSGVFVFFVLSGYLMGKGFVKGRYAFNKPLRFYWRRFFRIVPAYLIFVLGAFIIAPIVLAPTQFQSTVVHLLVFLYPGKTDAQGVLVHLWTISTEMQFYLFVPLIAMALAGFRTRLRGFPILAGIVICLCAGALTRGLAFPE